MTMANFHRTLGSSRDWHRLPQWAQDELAAARDAEAEAAELRLDVEVLESVIADRDAELVELRKRLWTESGGEPMTLPLSLSSPGFRGLTIPSA